MSNKFTPYFNKIHIVPIQEDTILIPDDGQLKKEIGKVVAIGDYVNFCKVGDLIAFASWGAEKIEHEGETYWAVAEDPRFIIGKFTEQKNGRKSK